MERLSGEQEELLHDILSECEPGVMITRTATHALKELADEGYLDDFDWYYDGRATFVVSEKSIAYFEEIERKERDARKSSRHDWAITGTNAIVAIVAAVIGGIMGFILGRM